MSRFFSLGEVRYAQTVVTMFPYIGDVNRENRVGTRPDLGERPRWLLRATNYGFPYPSSAMVDLSRRGPVKNHQHPVQASF